MALETIGVGQTIGGGGSSLRIGMSPDSGVGFIEPPHDLPTPKEAAALFRTLGRAIYDAATDGNSQWTVVGVPCPVEDDVLLGPAENIPGISDRQYHLLDELRGVDNGLDRVLAAGYPITVVNDGELAAQAVARNVGKGAFGTVAAEIDGTGLGAGIARKDEAIPEVYRGESVNPAELGHTLVGLQLHETLENMASGPAIKRMTGYNAEDLPADHPYWRTVALCMRAGIVNLGLMFKAELVVPTGGVGAGASDKYGPHLQEAIAEVATVGNKAQRFFLPKVKLIDPNDAHYFELHGGPGIRLDRLTR